MTSTNDGKDVKSYQTSGPKGKSHYIELYKSLEARLSEVSEPSVRTQHLCEAWRQVHTLCLHSALSTHPHLLSWLQRHTARIILQTKWQSAERKDDRATLETAIDGFIAQCHQAASERDSFPWETQLIERGEWFKKVLDRPWDHPVLSVLLNPSGTPPTDDEVLSWLVSERGVTFVMRLQTLVAEKCEDIAASLAVAIMDRVRARAVLVPDQLQTDDKDKSKLSPAPSDFAEKLSTEAGFTPDVWELLTDIEFVLLHKRDSSRCIALAKQTPLKSAYQLVERLQSRLELAPREKRLWKNAKDVAVLIAQVVIARCMVIPVCAGIGRNALYCCSRSLARALGAKLAPAAAALAAPAASARHLHTLATAVDAHFTQNNDQKMKPFVCELYVRAITAGMNELERLKIKTEKESEARQMEQTLASWFVQLGAVLSSSDRIRCECMLTAFSVHPSMAMYERIKAAPTLPKAAVETESLPKEEPTSEFGSWASDSRSQTNFVKTSETLNMKQMQNQANVLSTAILNEGEALGLSPDLCHDIAVLLSGPRVKTLSWDMDREQLIEKCRAYMERTHGGTRALTTELKYLNLDPNEFMHLPEEDDDENDIYYGIEKGYEHLVQFQDPEDIWEDPERTESHSTHSGSDVDVVTSRRKKKGKKLTLSSDDDADPLSIVAENQRNEKKERPHSKERSKERKKKESASKDPLEVKPPKEKKEKPPKKEKEKKEKKKKVKSSRESLAKLIGIKMLKQPSRPKKAVNATVPASVTDSDCDSQGKCSFTSLNSDHPDVLYDGLFSMNELKSPERVRAHSDNIGLNRNEFNVSNGQDGLDSPINCYTNNQPVLDRHRKPVSYLSHSPNMVTDEVKKSLYKLIDDRRQKSMAQGNQSPIPYHMNLDDSIRSYRSYKAIASKNIQNQTTQSKKVQNAIVRPKTPLQTCISPKAVAIPEIPKSIINKESQRLIQIKKDVEDYLQKYQRNVNDVSIPSPVIQYAKKHNETQTQYTNPLKMSDLVTVPQERYGPYDTKPVFTQSRPGGPVHRPPIRETPGQLSYQKFLEEFQRSVDPSIKETPGQQSYQNFVQEFQRSVDEKFNKSLKKEMKPVSRVPPVIPNVNKAETKTPQRAKPIPQQKKPDNSLNTFSRLSYMHKNKQTDIKNKTIEAPDHRNVSKTSLENKIEDFVLEHLRKSSQNQSSPVDSPKILNEYQNQSKPESSRDPKYPVLSNMLHSQIGNPNAYTTKPKKVKPLLELNASPRNSYLSEKDQNDLIILLRQQNRFDSPAPSSRPMNLKTYSTCTQSPPTIPVTTVSNCSSPSTSAASIIITSKNPANENKQINIISTSIIKPANSAPNAPNTIKPTNIAKKNIKVDVKKPESFRPRILGKAEVKKSEDWQAVMNAIRAQKTPTRGPNALDVALNKSSFEKAFEDSLLHREFSEQDSDIEANTAKIDKPQAIKHSICSVNTATTNNSKSVKTNTRPKVINKSEGSLKEVSAIKYNMKTKNMTQKKPNNIDISHKLPVEQPKKRLPYGGHKGDDPFISGIPNSDYDLIEELMDDDLRKEIGELSSDEEYTAAALNILKPTKPNEKRVSVIYNKTLDTPPTHQKSVVANQGVQLQKCIYENKAVQGPPKLVNHQYNATSKQCMNVSTPNIAAPSCSSQTHVFSNTNTYVSNSIAVDPNVYITAISQPPVQNVVLLGSNVVYESYPNVQRPVAITNITPNAFVAVNNIPNMTLYQSTQYAAPIINPVIIESAITMPVVSNMACSVPVQTNAPNNSVPPEYNTNSQTPSVQEYSQTTVAACKLSKTESRPNYNSDDRQLINDNVKTDVNMTDTNLNKNSDRKVLSEVQEKQVFSQVHEKPVAPEIGDQKEKPKKIDYNKIIDQERLRKKRIAIMNRKISYYSDRKPIALGYSPIYPVIKNTLSESEIYSGSERNIEDQKLDAGLEVASPASQDSIDNCKENKDNALSCRRILLRSSNKLKVKVPNDTSTKIINKSITVEAPKIAQEAKTIAKIVKEGPKRKRVSKRLRNKSTIKQKTEKQKQRRLKLNVCKKVPVKMKPKEVIEKVERVEESIDSALNFLDIEAELVGSKIPKICNIDLKTNNCESVSNDRTKEDEELVQSLLQNDGNNKKPRSGIDRDTKIATRRSSRLAGNVNNQPTKDINEAEKFTSMSTEVEVYIPILSDNNSTQESELSSEDVSNLPNVNIEQDDTSLPTAQNDALVVEQLSELNQNQMDPETNHHGTGNNTLVLDKTESEVSEKFEDKNVTIPTQEVVEPVTISVESINIEAQESCINPVLKSVVTDTEDRLKQDVTEIKTPNDSVVVTSKDKSANMDISDTNATIETSSNTLPITINNKEKDTTLANQNDITQLNNSAPIQSQTAETVNLNDTVVKDVIVCSDDATTQLNNSATIQSQPAKTVNSINTEVDAAMVCSDITKQLNNSGPIQSQTSETVDLNNAVVDDVIVCSDVITQSNNFAPTQSQTGETVNLNDTVVDDVIVCSDVTTQLNNCAPTQSQSAETVNLHDTVVDDVIVCSDVITQLNNFAPTQSQTAETVNSNDIVVDDVVCSDVITQLNNSAPTQSQSAETVNLNDTVVDDVVVCSDVITPLNNSALIQSQTAETVDLNNTVEDDVVCSDVITQLNNSAPTQSQSAKTVNFNDTVVDDVIVCSDVITPLNNSAPIQSQTAETVDLNNTVEDDVVCSDVIKSTNNCKPVDNKTKNNVNLAEIPQSFKDSIKIDHIPNQNFGDPLKKSVRIKLPNGRVFKATVYGQVNVNFDSLFQEPSIKSVLLNSLTSNNKKYTLNVKQTTSVSKQDLRVMSTEVHQVIRKNQGQIVDTVDLLSDDDEEIYQEFTTEFGKYKIQPIDTEVYKMHQNQFKLKSKVFLKRCDHKKDRSVPTNIIDLSNKDVLSKDDCIQLDKLGNRTVDTSSEKFKENVYSNSKIDEDIIIVDDSKRNEVKNKDIEDDDVVLIDDSSSEDEISIRNKDPQVINVLTNKLLIDLGVGITTPSVPKIDDPMKLKDMILQDLGIDVISNDSKDTHATLKPAGNIDKTVLSSVPVEIPEIDLTEESAISELTSNSSQDKDIKKCFVKLVRCDDLVDLFVKRSKKKSTEKISNVSTEKAIDICIENAIDVNAETGIDINAEKATYIVKENIDIAVANTGTSMGANSDFTVSGTSVDMNTEKAISVVKENLNVDVATTEIRINANSDSIISKTSVDKNAKNPTLVVKENIDANNDSTISETNVDMNAEKAKYVVKENIDVEIANIEASIDINNDSTISETSVEINVQKGTDVVRQNTEVDVRNIETSIDANNDSTISIITDLDEAIPTPRSRSNSFSILDDFPILNDIDMECTDHDRSSPVIEAFDLIASHENFLKSKVKSFQEMPLTCDSDWFATKRVQSHYLYARKNLQSSPVIPLRCDSEWLTTKDVRSKQSTIKSYDFGPTEVLANSDIEDTSIIVVPALTSLTLAYLQSNDLINNLQPINSAYNLVSRPLKRKLVSSNVSVSGKLKRKLVLPNEVSTPKITKLSTLDETNARINSSTDSDLTDMSDVTISDEDTTKCKDNPVVLDSVECITSTIKEISNKCVNAITDNISSKDKITEILNNRTDVTSFMYDEVFEKQVILDRSDNAEITNGNNANVVSEEDSKSDGVVCDNMQSDIIDVCENEFVDSVDPNSSAISGDSENGDLTDIDTNLTCKATTESNNVICENMDNIVMEQPDAEKGKTSSLHTVEIDNITDISRDSENLISGYLNEQLNPAEMCESKSSEIQDNISVTLDESENNIISVVNGVTTKLDNFCGYMGEDTTTHNAIDMYAPKIAQDDIYVAAVSNDSVIENEIKTITDVICDEIMKSNCVTCINVDSADKECDKIETFENFTAPETELEENINIRVVSDDSNSKEHSLSDCFSGSEVTKDYKLDMIKRIANDENVVSNIQNVEVSPITVVDVNDTVFTSNDKIDLLMSKQFTKDSQTTDEPVSACETELSTVEPRPTEEETADNLRNAKVIPEDIVDENSDVLEETPIVNKNEDIATCSVSNFLKDDTNKYENQTDASPTSADSSLNWEMSIVNSEENTVESLPALPNDAEKLLTKYLKLTGEEVSEIVLKGIEYVDPEAGTCYMFPLVEQSCSPENSLEGAERDEIINLIRGVTEEGTNGKKVEEVLDCDTDLEVILPTNTYSKVVEGFKITHNLKRKRDMSDVRFQDKKYRKGKNIDYPKITVAAMNETVYVKEYKRLIDYYSTLKFSYSRPFHKENIDIDDMMANWPLQGANTNTSAELPDVEATMFSEGEENVISLKDPLEQTLAQELNSDYNEAEYKPIEIVETNFSMGFGEGSGRVIQHSKTEKISKLSAATLSDVKPHQPYLSSENNSIKIDKALEESNDEKTKLIQNMNLIKLKEKVRSFFKKTATELTFNFIKEHKECSDEDTFNFPFGFTSTDFFGQLQHEVVVNVVQVGQLPVSAAAQNPVTCDPRVTHVSNVSPSQCSAENSPGDDNQTSIKTEYTELTTADITLPLVQEYAQHHHQFTSNDAQESSKIQEADHNTCISTEINSEIKIELTEETSQDNMEENDSYENEPLLIQSGNNVNNGVPYIYNEVSNNASVESHPNRHTIPDEAKISNTFSESKDEGNVNKTDQLAHAMNAAGITTSSNTINTSNADALVDIISQNTQSDVVTTTQMNTNNYSKSTPINAMALQQALAQILPPPLSQTSTSESGQTPNNAVAPPVLHIVQGSNSQTVLNTQNGTPLLHIVQNKNATATNGTPSSQANSFGGLSLVDTGLQQGGNQLLHIVNTGNQKNNNAGQLLKRVNLLTNIANVQGSNEQKMVQFVCKSADGKSIQLNAPHQRSMVLRLQPIDPSTIQTTPKPTETQDVSATSGNPINNKDMSQQEIKSRSVYEENYAKFIQNGTGKPGQEKATSLPKFNQVFGKQVSYQENKNEINNERLSENTDGQQNESVHIDQINEINNPPLLLRKSTAQTSQAPTNLVQQIKQTIAPMNIQTMHGGVIYTRQIPVNIGGGQTINLITVPSTELVDDSQKQQTDNKFSNQDGDHVIKIVQNQPNNSNAQNEDNNNSQMNSGNDAPQAPQPQPVLTQMRIKLPMLSKTPQMVSAARVVRPSFFQIQRNVIGGANQPVYQQLVLTTAPSLGQSIRVPAQAQPSRPTKPPESQSSPESQMSTSTLEQLREFDMVLEQVKERSTVQPGSSNSNSFSSIHSSADTTDSSAVVSTSVTETTQQVLYTTGNQTLNIASYVNRKSTVTSASTAFVRSPDSSGIVESPSSSTHNHIPHTAASESTSSETPTQPKPKKKKSKPSSSSTSAMKLNTTPPKTSTQKPLEDEQTTQRILYILAEYKEQVENSPDKDKPAPRRRNNLPTNASGSSKRKKSSSGSRRRDMSPILGEDSCRTMGSEDSSCGTSLGECAECMESHSPQESPRKVVRRLTFEQETTTTTTTQVTTQTRTIPQRNVIVADGQTITVARGAAGKPATTVLMPANYLLPVSMVKGGQQIAIVTNRGPKLLVGSGEGGTGGTLLFQRLIGPAGLKPVLTRPGVRHIRLPTAALHNLQTFNLAGAAAPVDSTASPAPAPAPAPPDLVDSRAMSSPWPDREAGEVKPERGSSPEGSEPWNLPSSSIADDYGYEEVVRTDNMDRTVLDAIPDRYSPDMEAQRIFDKMFDVDSKKSMYDSSRCGYDIDASDTDDRPYQVVQRKDGRHHRLTHVSAAALRHKYAILEHELRLQKSLSEECEDLGVDSPSASELFPEAELLFAPSPVHEQTIGPCHTPQPTILNQGVPHPDIDDQIATDHLLTPRDRQSDLDINLDDVGEIVTVGEDGMATIPLDHEEFARSHPNTTFHTEPEDGEIPPFTIAQSIKGRQITFHANRGPSTVVMAPQTTVISQATVEASGTQNTVKFTDIDNMINAIPSTQAAPQMPSVLVKEDGLTRFDNILTDSRELHLSNTASAIVHSTGQGTQVIRRVRYDENRRESRYLIDEPDPIEEKIDDNRDLESMAGDDNSSPERHPELFWESNSASERSEGRRRLDFSSDSDKCCKSPFDDSTDSSFGNHTRLDSVIKAARTERSGSDGSSDDHPPLRTYPAKRTHHHPPHHDAEQSLSGKTRAGERCMDVEGRRRASNRGVVKRGCHCCNGSPAPPKPKKSRQKKTPADFTNSNNN